MSPFTKKTDVVSNLYGLENYHPGEDSVKKLAIRVSSGTSGSGLSMLVRDNLKIYPERYLSQFKRSIVIFGRNPSALGLINFLFHYTPAERVMLLDDYDLQHPEIGRLIEEFGPSELHALPTSHLRAILLRFKVVGILNSLKTIKLISVSGELLSVVQKEKLRSFFSSSSVCVSNYGASEVGAAAYSCPILDKTYEGQDIMVLHPWKKLIIVNKNEEGVGDIIISTTELGDYKTGDRGKIIEEECACGEKFTFIPYGRTDFDVVTAAGALFLLPEVERGLGSLSSLVVRFRVEVSESEDEHALRGLVTVKIVPTKQGDLMPNLKEVVTNTLEENLFVTRTRTLGELVQEKIFSPTEVVIGTDDLLPDTAKEVKLMKV